VGVVFAGLFREGGFLSDEVVLEVDDDDAAVMFKEAAEVFGETVVGVLVLDVELKFKIFAVRPLALREALEFPVTGVTVPDTLPSDRGVFDKFVEEELRDCNLWAMEKLLTVSLARIVLNPRVRISSSNADKFSSFKDVKNLRKNFE